jgi:hypothetical protein
MEEVSQLRQLAARHDPDGFAALVGDGLFLVKELQTTQQSSSAPPASSRATYQTTQIRVDSELLDLHDVFGSGLVVWRIAKRRENPFSDRVSVGRAPNCDIALRLPYLSKLHAHFFLDEAETVLADNDSSNGTFLNDQRLQAGQRQTVAPGDTVGFGAVRLRVVDARALHELLTG